MKSKQSIFNIALMILLVVLFVSICLINSNFFKPDYLLNVVLRNIVELCMIALPVTLIVITGGIDLSVGSIAVLCAVAGGTAFEATGSNAFAIIIMLLVGIACGVFNGLLVAKINISPLVATLATLYLFMGIARVITEGKSVPAFPASQWLGNYQLFGKIPIQIIFCIVFCIAFYILLAKTYFGKYLYSIGLNENAAKFSGIDTQMCKIIIYTLSGIVCSFAAMIMLGRFSTIKYTGGDGMNLKVVTMIVLGGASINGGSGDMRGTIIAALIIAVLNSGLTVLNIPIDVQTIVQGAVLLISLIAYAVIHKRTAKTAKTSKG